MSALTDRLLAEPEMKAFLDGMRNTVARIRGDSSYPAEPDFVGFADLLLRALAGETLDAAAEAMREDAFPDDPITWERLHPIIRANYVGHVQAAAPILRAPLLVQVAELSDAYKASNAAMLSEADRANRAEAQLAAAREALKEYGMHFPGCLGALWRDHGERCSCGYTAALTGATQK